MEKTREKLKYNSIIQQPMQTFQTTPKHWGNSLGITIPEKIVAEEKLTPKNKVVVFLYRESSQEQLKKLFGTLKCSKPTQQIMDEIDEGYDEH